MEILIHDQMFQMPWFPFTEQGVTDMLISAGFKHISRIEFESGLSQMIALKN